MKLLRTPKIVQTFLLGGLCLVTLLVSGLGAPSVNATPYVSTDRYWKTNGGTMTNWSGRWEWSSQVGDASLCSQRGGCSMSLCLFRTMSMTPISTKCVGNTAILNVNLPRGTTESQAQKLWVAKYGTSGTWYIGPWSLPAWNTECIGLAVWNINTSFGVQGIIFPGSSCGKAPPLNLACDTSGKVTIDYGTLSSGQLNGATASTNLSFTCNQAATATIKLNDSVIDLGRKGDLTAAISIGGKDLASGSDVAVTNGTVTTTITSTLKAKGTPVAGAFEGSGVLIIGYQ
ncbi:hypothetical protein AB6848_24915 [Serratia proteamaculans]|uniref:MrpH family fimbial adhesin n=1 Tax=Serratia proteamaculans TaxID=28151 RepID=UPI0039AEEEE1